MNEERAVLAGGCFWGVQELIRREDGVLSTRVGYTGGEIRNATYRNHGYHAEAAAAHRVSEARHLRGKLVLRVH